MALLVFLLHFALEFRRVLSLSPADSVALAYFFNVVELVVLYMDQATAQAVDGEGWISTKALDVIGVISAEAMRLAIRVSCCVLPVNDFHRRRALTADRQLGIPRQRALEAMIH